jgi:hypothetical protein
MTTRRDNGRASKYDMARREKKKKKKKKKEVTAADEDTKCEMYKHYWRCVHRIIGILKRQQQRNDSLPFSHILSLCPVYVFLRVICTTMIDITHEQQEQPIGYTDDVRRRYEKGWLKQKEWMDRGVEFWRRHFGLHDDVKQE